MRVSARPTAWVGDSDAVEQVDSPHPCLPPVRLPVRAVHLGDLTADGSVRIECRERILEDHADLASANLLRRSDEVVAVESDRATDAGVSAVVQAEQCQPDGGLASPRLADDAQRAAGFEAERDTSYSSDLAVPGSERDS